MIHKFWNVRLATPSDSPDHHPTVIDDEKTRDLVRQQEERMEEKVYRIWSVLSTFEESSAACISDMLLHVSNGSYVDGVVVAKKFIWHVDILFRSADRLDETMNQLEMKRMGIPPPPDVLLLTVPQLFPTHVKQNCCARRLCNSSPSCLRHKTRRLPSWE